MIRRLSLAFVALCLSTAILHAEEWPQWRGPNRDGTSQEKNLADKWPDAGPKQIWTANVGIGYSSPIAQDGIVYLFHGTDGGAKDTLTAYDAKTGNVKWTQTYNAGWAGDYPGTRGTPSIDGKFIYTHGGRGILTCRELESGKQIWQTDMLSELHENSNHWGQGSSPLVVGDLVYVIGGQGGSVAGAFEKSTGKVAWQAEAKAPGSYSSPIAVDIEGKTEIIALGGSAAFGLDPKTGKTFWTAPFSTGGHINATTPFYRDGYLFLSAAYNHGSALFKITANSATQLWTDGQIMARFSPPILTDGILLVNSEGTLTALKWPTDERAFTFNQGNIAGMGGNFVKADGKFYFQSEAGKMTLATVSPQGIKPISSFKAFDARQTWSTPLIYQGRLYAKGGETFTCWDISTGNVQ